MAESYAIYTSDGISGDFAVPFEYFSINHVEVRTNNIIVGFTPLTANLIRITPTPAAGVVVTIRRRTPPDLTVTPRDFPKFIQYVTEENVDIVYNFDSLYGEIYYDMAVSVTDGLSASTVIAVVDPQLTLKLTGVGSSVTLSDPPVGDVVFSIESSSDDGATFSPLATATVASGALRGTVVLASGVADSTFPSGTLYRFVETSGDYATATIILRTTRL